MDILSILIVVALFATIVALSLGLMVMSGGGAAHRAFGTRLMWSRVLLQALVVALLFIALLIR